ncbi:COG1216 Predicted glycosyltransferases [Mycobacteriaceae bacterium]
MGKDEQVDSTAGLSAGRRIGLDDRVLVWRDAAVVLGGAPWGVLRIAPAARPFVHRLQQAAAAGLRPSPGVEQSVTDILLSRGIVHPLRVHDRDAGSEPTVEVVVPAYERPESLDACLTALTESAPLVRVIVVDDGSTTTAVAEVAHAHGATLIRHPSNRGPAAARNTGLAMTSAPIVAFVDADCAVTPGWLSPLVAHFDDPRVAAVAPRIRPRTNSEALLPRYERCRSALDMGPRPELVAPGSALGYLPSATLLVRRNALQHLTFDETMRVGEDVDLIWRLLKDGGVVRYEPASTVTHELRPRWTEWAGRHFAYGTSAAVLDSRHPRRLAPARLSARNLGIALLVLARRPYAAIGATGVSIALLARRLHDTAVDPVVAPIVVGKGGLAETLAVGHLLRREWWPLGWLALAMTPRSRIARFAAASMVVPLAQEWLTRRPGIDPVRYAALHLIEDAAYGSGVITGAIRRRRPGVLLPQVRAPRTARRGPSIRPLD